MTAPRRRSFATRTALVLLLGLAAVQGTGLLIHALDRVELQRVLEAREVGVRAAGLYRVVAADSAEDREATRRPW